MSGNATTSAWPEGDDLVACEDAARLLGVTAETLAQWSQQFAFPCGVSATEPLPHFQRREIEALQATLPSAHSVEGAIREAQRKLGG